MWWEVHPKNVWQEVGGERFILKMCGRKWEVGGSS